MGNLGFQEMLVIAMIAMVVAGPKRLPEIARALGEAVRAFQQALKGDATPPDEPHASDSDASRHS